MAGIRPYSSGSGVHRQQLLPRLRTHDGDNTLRPYNVKISLIVLKIFPQIDFMYQRLNDLMTVEVGFPWRDRGMKRGDRVCVELGSPRSMRGVLMTAGACEGCSAAGSRVIWSRQPMYMSDKNLRLAKKGN